MKRRLVLGVVGSIGGWSLSGCLDSTARSDGTNSSDSLTDDAKNESENESKNEFENESENELENESEGGNGQRSYEQCHFVSISYASLPDPIKSEVSAALDDGQYESDDLRFEEAVDPERSYIVVDGTPYEPAVTSEGDTDRLELQEADVVRQPEPAEITVENRADRDHEVRIELIDHDETLVDETVSLEPDDERDIEATDAFGAYELVAETLTGHREMDQFGFRIGDAYFDGVVTVDQEGIRATQGVADMEECWTR